MLCFAIRGYGISSNCFWWFLTSSTILLCFFSSQHSWMAWCDIMFPLCILQVEPCRRANIPRVKTHNIPWSYATEWENRAAVYTIITNVYQRYLSDGLNAKQIKCRDGMEHRGNFSSLWLFNSLWMAKQRPRTSSASRERSVVLYSTSTANKCFIALFTQWNLFHYFYKKANCPSQITALMKHNQSQRCSRRGATERNSMSEEERKKKQSRGLWVEWDDF